MIRELFTHPQRIETNYPTTKALRIASGEFEVYIRNSAGMIPNY